jgi:hypothetical protein
MGYGIKDFFHDAENVVMTPVEIGTQFGERVIGTVASGVGNAAGAVGRASNQATGAVKDTVDILRGGSSSSPAALAAAAASAASANMPLVLGIGGSALGTGGGGRYIGDSDASWLYAHDAATGERLSGVVADGLACTAKSSCRWAASLRRHRRPPNVRSAWPIC